MAGKGKGKFIFIVFFFIIANIAVIFWFASGSLFTAGKAKAAKTYKVSDFFGTMADKNALNKESIADQISFQGDGLSGEVITLKEDESVSAKIQINTEMNLLGKIEFDETLYGVASFSFLNQNNSGDVNINGNSIEFSNEGENEYFIIFRPKTEELSPIKFQLADGQGIIYEKEIKTDK